MNRSHVEVAEQPTEVTIPRSRSRDLCEMCGCLAEAGCGIGYEQMQMLCHDCWLLRVGRHDTGSEPCGRYAANESGVAAERSA